MLKWFTNMSKISNSKCCQKCYKQIPSSIEVNDVRYSIFTKRRYCFDCSPWKGRNNQKLESYDSINKICTICKEQKLRSEFSDTESRCKPCLNNIIRIKRIVFKEKCLAYLTPYCSVCGYKKCIAALQFHHLDKTSKKFEICHSVCKDFDKVKNELDKCIVLCFNCHMEAHFSSDS